VRDEEIVLGREGFLAGAQVDAVVEEGEPHRRRVGQRDVGRRPAEIGGGRIEHARLQPRPSLVQVMDRVHVQSSPVRLDRPADRPRVGREQEAAEVSEVTREAELLAHDAPRARRRLRSRERGLRLLLEHARGCEREAAAEEEGSSIERHAVSMARRVGLS
jgi:hypothetical protein